MTKLRRRSAVLDLKPTDLQGLVEEEVDRFGKTFDVRAPTGLACARFGRSTGGEDIAGFPAGGGGGSAAAPDGLHPAITTLADKRDSTARSATRRQQYALLMALYPRTGAFAPDRMPVLPAVGPRHY